MPNIDIPITSMTTRNGDKKIMPPAGVTSGPPTRTRK